jgi:hypothetical protein
MPSWERAFSPDARLPPGGGPRRLDRNTRPDALPARSRKDPEAPEARRQRQEAIQPRIASHTARLTTDISVEMTMVVAASFSFDLK